MFFRSLTNSVLAAGVSLLSLMCLSCAGGPPTETPAPEIPAPQTVKASDRILKEMKAIEPFFEPMGEPGAMDWLATYPEGGQTFEQYINGNPVRATGERRTIYIQPLGKFTAEEYKVVELTSEFMTAFYNLPVKLLPKEDMDEPLSLEDYRIHKSWKVRQIRTGYILDEVLLPKLPADAAALIAFTAEDLYPNEAMNFVFGQASLQNRVGVWSLYRLKEGNARYETFLARTLKIAMHETGHMFSIAHCTKYKCVMSGTNGNFETDVHPLDACPEDAAKIAWAMEYPARERYRRLAEFCERNGLSQDARSFREKLKAVDDLSI